MIVVFCSLQLTRKAQISDVSYGLVQDFDQSLIDKKFNQVHDA